MIITASLINQVSDIDEKATLRNLAGIYGQDEIGIGEIMAYFFSRYKPHYFPRFLIMHRFIFQRVEITPGSLVLISENDLPSIESVVNIIDRYAYSKKNKIYVLLNIFFDDHEFINLTNKELSGCIGDQRIPQWLRLILDDFLKDNVNDDDKFICNWLEKRDMVRSKIMISDKMKKTFGYTLDEFFWSYSLFMHSDGLLFYTKS